MQRRDFLKTTMLTGAAVAGRSWVQAAGAPLNRVRLAVMGVGGRGSALMQSAMHFPDIEIAAVCDVDSRAMDKAAAEVAKQSGKTPKRDKDIRRILEDKEIDGVICASPDHWHAPCALMTMQAGKGIYVEKPCSHNPREGEILVAAAKKYNAVFQMGNQRRSIPIYRQVIKEIREGLIGEPRFARCWYTTQRGPIGNGKVTAVPEWLDWNLWQGPAPRRPFRDNIVPYQWHWFLHWGTGEAGNNATHYVDIARWALGVHFPTRVTSGGGRLFYEGDDWEWFDTQSATFEFPEKKLITWEGLSAVRARPYEGVGTGCMVYGLEGAILFSPNSTCTLYDKAGKKLRDWTSNDLTGDAMNRTNPTSGLDERHIENWTTCLRAGNSNTNVTAIDAHASTLLPHLANLAQRTGETIRIDAQTGGLAKGSAGTELWSRDYEPGWEMSL